MSDLISRKALANELQKYFVNNTIHKNDLAEVLATRPTAFDVEAVVKELEESKGQAFLTLANTGQAVFDFAYNQVLAYLDKAIEIVRKDGVK